MHTPIVNNLPKAGMYVSTLRPASLRQPHERAAKGLMVYSRTTVRSAASEFSHHSPFRKKQNQTRKWVNIPMKKTCTPLLSVPSVVTPAHCTTSRCAYRCASARRARCKRCLRCSFTPSLNIPHNRNCSPNGLSSVRKRLLFVDRVDAAAPIFANSSVASPCRYRGVQPRVSPYIFTI